eukprot:TCONS_00015320-protein
MFVKFLLWHSFVLVIFVTRFIITEPSSKRSRATTDILNTTGIPYIYMTITQLFPTLRKNKFMLPQNFTLHTATLLFHLLEKNKFQPQVPQEHRKYDNYFFKYDGSI